LARFIALSLIGTALVAGAAAAPAAAGVIDYGAIAKCRYTATVSSGDFWTEALLKKIAVQPPTVAKTVGTKSVGWRFIVERSLARDFGPWQVTYRSPLQRAARSADFTPMRVAVHVPAESNTPNGQDHVYYRVTLKLFWYATDGSVQNKVSHLMNDMTLALPDGEVTDSWCQGLALQFA
jgi:hypothetical protein